MAVPLITEADVRRLLPMREAVALMRRVFEDLGTGKAQNLPRRRLRMPSGAMLHMLAGAFGAYFGTKVYSSHPRYGANFQAMLYDASDARPLAMFEANALGQIRTGAASGFATDLLARPEARTLAVIGTGFQARTQIEAMLVVRPFERVRVWGRDAERRIVFARECSEACGVAVEAAESAEQAVRGADVIVTVTSAKDPVLDAAWVDAGAHVNAIGSNNPARRELPAELIQAAGLIAVDSLEQARMESGDLILALDEQGWSDPRLVELADLASGKRTWERTAAPTIFKSNGLGVEDVAAAGFVYERAITAQDPPPPHPSLS
jgi:ornithine cyclodeaminase/alanine dehydrogenase-like protein (mu-crystallin family)